MNSVEFARGVLVNLCVLLALAAVIGIFRGWSRRLQRKVAAWQMGALFGIMAVVAMVFPVITRGGMIFDCRSGVIGTAAFLGGPVAALAAVPLPLLYRATLGGGGMWFGLLEIILPALLGSACYPFRGRPGEGPSLLRLLVASLFVGLASNAIIMSAVVDFRPDSAVEIGFGGTLLVLFGTTICMALLGSLMLLEQAHIEAIEALAESESRARHSQKMAAIGQLSRKITHNFMNTLSAILGHAQLAQAKLDNPDEAREQLAYVVDRVHRASALAGELLAFANPSAPKTRRLDLSKCIVGVREMLSRSIGSEVDVVIDANRSAGTVEADPEQVEQAVVHLVVNAAEAISGSGRIVVSVRPARISTRERNRLQAGIKEPDRHRNPFALLSVSDTGEGMSAETCARIFEPFFTTRTGKQNAGLGLATVYGIAQLHDALIDVQSTPGEGTTMLLYFPVVERSAREPSGKADG